MCKRYVFTFVYRCTYNNGTLIPYRTTHTHKCPPIADRIDKSDGPYGFSIKYRPYSPRNCVYTMCNFCNYLSLFYSLFLSPPLPSLTLNVQYVGASLFVSKAINDLCLNERLIVCGFQMCCVANVLKSVLLHVRHIVLVISNR